MQNFSDKNAKRLQTLPSNPRMEELQQEWMATLIDFYQKFSEVGQNLIAEMKEAFPENNNDELEIMAAPAVVLVRSSFLHLTTMLYDGIDKKSRPPAEMLQQAADELTEFLYLLTVTAHIHPVNPEKKYDA